MLTIMEYSTAPGVDQAMYGEYFCYSLPQLADLLFTLCYASLVSLWACFILLFTKNRYPYKQAKI